MDRKEAMARSFFLALLLALITLKAHGWYWSFPSKHPTTLSLKNTSHKDQTLWLLTFHKTLQEKHFTLAPQKTLKIKIDESFKGASWVELRCKGCSKVKASLSVSIGGQWLDWPTTLPATLPQLSLPQEIHKSDTLWITSHGVGKQQVFLEGILSHGEKIALKTLQVQGQTQTQVPLSELSQLKKVQTLQLKAPARTSFFLLRKQKQPQVIQGKLKRKRPSKFKKGVHYFVLKHRSAPSAPQFLIAIKKPEYVKHAQNLLQNPKLSRSIVIGHIGVEHDDYNRNPTHPLAPMWSWQVKEVLGFSDLGSILCDGSPDNIEWDLKRWLKPSQTICFWNYQIVREISF